MEKDFNQAETSPGPFSNLIELIVEDARRSVEEHETREERIAGCMAGLERCTEMRDLGVLEFELELRNMQEVTRAMKVPPFGGEHARREYWYQRCATAQVEYCYEILRAAHRAEHGELPDANRDDLSARAVMRYNLLAMKLEMSQRFLPE